MSKEISREQYLQFVGLLTLAVQHNRALADIERAACEITGEVFRSGSHTGDAVYSDTNTADETLAKLGITVVKDAP